MLKHHHSRISSRGIRLVQVALGTTAAVLTTLGTPANGGQDAVQWAASEGGNGHWYRHDLVPYSVGTELCGLEWAVAHSSSLGGHPLTITSAGENDFALEVLPYFNGIYSTAKLGCYRPSGTDQWQWVTGEPFEYDNFITGSSNRTADLYDDESIFGPGWREAAWCLHVEVVGGQEAVSVIVEWSADCNGDGIVDYGQILDGTFNDDNGNGIPDCCDLGIPCATEWGVEEGGNGHWYAYVSGDCDDSTSAEELIAAAEALGGHLVTFADESEWDFVRLSYGGLRLGDPCVADWFLGLTSSPGSYDWHWVTGEPVVFDAWGTAACGAGPYPNNAPSSTLAYTSNRSDCGQVWDDGVVGSVSRNLMVEFSADCNGDGVVDYGQILSGELSDLDGDRVPDICDCLADINNDGMVDAADLGILLAFWGDPATFPAADLTGDGEVNGADLGALFVAWGPCGTGL